ncbi:hypothetical protein PR048_030709 [Dryococelus australis]|uniref:Uncharacterized protein n=1 Tax=Dryococelus australis TaxID=614101 RepID=A0ABQ9GC95_9NEOP|nr:hypothetical protein PR048_030709 [Dryococelus australis]
MTTSMGGERKQNARRYALDRSVEFIGSFFIVSERQAGCRPHPLSLSPTTSSRGCCRPTEVSWRSAAEGCDPGPRPLKTARHPPSRTGARGAPAPDNNRNSADVVESSFTGVEPRNISPAHQGQHISGLGTSPESAASSTPLAELSLRTPDTASLVRSRKLRSPPSLGRPFFRAHQMLRETECVWHMLVLVEMNKLVERGQERYFSFALASARDAGLTRDVLAGAATGLLVSVSWANTYWYLDTREESHAWFTGTPITPNRQSGKLEQPIRSRPRCARESRRKIELAPIFSSLRKSRLRRYFPEVTCFPSVQSIIPPPPHPLSLCEDSCTRSIMGGNGLRYSPWLRRRACCEPQTMELSINKIQWCAAGSGSRTLVSVKAGKSLDPRNGQHRTTSHETPVFPRTFIRFPKKMVGLQVTNRAPAYTACVVACEFDSSLVAPICGNVYQIAALCVYTEPRFLESKTGNLHVSTSVQSKSRQSQCSRVLQAPSRTVGFTRRFRTLSSIRAANTSPVFVPQSSVVVHTLLCSCTLTQAASIKDCRPLGCGSIYRRRGGLRYHPVSPGHSCVVAKLIGNSSSREEDCDASKSRRCSAFTGFPEGGIRRPRAHHSRKRRGRGGSPITAQGQLSRRQLQHITILTELFAVFLSANGARARFDVGLRRRRDRAASELNHYQPLQVLADLEHGATTSDKAVISWSARHTLYEQHFPVVRIALELFSGVSKAREAGALAGNRTRINCLEGNYADHYTTNASCVRTRQLRALIWLRALEKCIPDVTSPCRRPNSQQGAKFDKIKLEVETNTSVRIKAVSQFAERVPSLNLDVTESPHCCPNSEGRKRERESERRCTLVGYVAAPERKGGGNGITPRKPADQWNRPARFPHVKIQGVAPHGIEPSSLW